MAVLILRGTEAIIISTSTVMVVLCQGMLSEKLKHARLLVPCFPGPLTHTQVLKSIMSTSADWWLCGRGLEGSLRNPCLFQRILSVILFPFLATDFHILYWWKYKEHYRRAHGDTEVVKQLLGTSVMPKTTLCFWLSFLLLHTLGDRSDDSSTWVPATPKRDQDEVPGPCLQLGSALIIAGIWGLSEWMEDILPTASPLSFSHCLSFCLSNK